MQTTPYTPAPKQFGSEAQRPLPTDTSPLLDKKGIRRVQQIVGSILYYAPSCGHDMPDGTEFDRDRANEGY